MLGDESIRCWIFYRQRKKLASLLVQLNCRNERRQYFSQTVCHKQNTTKPRILLLRLHSRSEQKNRLNKINEYTRDSRPQRKNVFTVSLFSEFSRVFLILSFLFLPKTKNFYFTIFLFRAIFVLKVASTNFSLNFFGNEHFAQWTTRKAQRPSNQINRKVSFSIESYDNNKSMKITREKERKNYKIETKSPNNPINTAPCADWI